jgi:phosphoribosylglycinamide formyltransferase-1
MRTLMTRYVILISGRGSNMDALLDAGLPGECVGVISNRPEAAGLAVAALRGVATYTLDHRSFANRETFDAALADRIDGLQPDLVLLAGFMRILTPGFVERFAGRLLNIHPSLLPTFPGVRTHEQALAAGVRVHGCTVHFVTSALDGGPIIAQAAVPVLAGDDAVTLAQRVLAQEHRLYPAVARWFLDGKLRLTADQRVIIDDEATTTGALTVPQLND